MCAKGNFSREDIVTVLTANQGNVEAAFQELNKVQLKPFLMRIWGQGEVGEVTSGQVPEEHQGTHLLSFVINNNTYVLPDFFSVGNLQYLPTHDDIFVASFHSGGNSKASSQLIFFFDQKTYKSQTLMLNRSELLVLVLLWLKFEIFLRRCNFLFLFMQIIFQYKTFSGHTYY